MINVTSYLNELGDNRNKIDTGIHPILRMGYNRYVYAVAFTLSFALMYFLINKIVYFLTENDYIYELCVQKYKLKNRSKKSSKIVLNETSSHSILINKDEIEKSDGGHFEIENKQSYLNNEEVKYNLWFYRFSCMECISCIFCFPILLLLLLNFDAFHNELFTHVSWITYTLPTMIMGHYLVDFNEVLSYGYGSRSKDLLLHHLLVTIAFIYHLVTLNNYPFVNTVLFMEFNSFFNRSNLILKYHDAKKINFWFNMSNIGNFLTMIFVRFGIIIRMAHFVYFVFILSALLGLTYLAWKSLRYMLFNDFIHVKLFLFKQCCNS